VARATGTNPAESLASAATRSPRLFLPGMYVPSDHNPQKGLAWNGDSQQDPYAVNDARPFDISWYYNWGFDPPDAEYRMTVGGEFIPMQWCEDYFPSTPIDYSGYLLFLNEPNRSDQCGGHIGNNLEIAVDLYEDVLYYYPNAKLIGPNISFQPYGPNNSYAGYLEAWRNEVLSRPGPPRLPDGYGIHLYSSPGGITAEQVAQAFCDKLFEWGELDKELWVTEFRWANDWVNPTWPAPTQEAFIATQVSNQFGFFDNGLQVGTPSASETCKITRYSWYTNRLGPVILPGTPTPIATPVSNVGYSSF
jgi:hypothetical protein